MKNNGFLGLCSEQGYAELPWENPRNGTFSIIMQFLPDTVSAQGGLFSLGEVFSLELSKEKLSLQAGSDRSVSSESVVLRHTNTVAAVSEGSKLTIYLNGLSVIEKKDADMTACFLQIGKNLKEACILRLSVYHEALSPIDICNRLVNKRLSCHNRIDFTRKDIPKTATLHQAEIKNYVYALNCKAGGFSLASVSLPKEYTISLSAILQEDGAKDMLLLCTPQMSIRLYDQYGLGQWRIVVTRPTHGAEQRYITPYVVETGKWITLTFVFGDSRGQIYFDGSLIQDFPCDTIPEKGEIALGAFAGSLGVFAVAKGIVQQKDIPDFLKRQFGALDTELLYLADFSENAKRMQWKEECHDKELQPRGGKIVFLRDSGAPLCTNNNRPGPVSGRRYSDFANWQIGILIRLLTEWLHEQLGIYPNRGNLDRSCNPWKLDENLHLFIHKEILSMNEAQILLYHYDNIRSDELQALILAMKENGTLEKLIAYLYQEDDDQKSIDAILYWLLAAALLAAAIAAMLPKLPAVPPPPEAPQSSDIDDPDDDDEKKKKKKTYVSISKTFLKGDMTITGNDDFAVDNADSEKTAVFCKGGSSPAERSLQVTLSFRGEKGQFTVHGENPNGKILLNVTEKVNYQEKSEIALCLNIKPERFTDRYGMCRETLRWRCESEDPENKQTMLLGETTFTFYFLEGSPCQPWSKTVNIECLKLCADCAEHAQKGSKGFFEDFIKFIQQDAGTGKKHYYKADSKQDVPWTFDANAFARDWRKTERRRDISQESRSISPVIFGALNGRNDLHLVVLASDIYYTRTVNAGDRERVDARLLLRRDNAADGVCCPEQIRQYLPGTANGIYDADTNRYFPFSEDTQRNVTGMQNDQYYREKKYIPGSACKVVSEITMWQIGNVAEMQPPALPMGWVAPGADGRYLYCGRTPFIPAVENEIKRQPAAHEYFSAVCHSISAREIDFIIEDICNNPQNNAADRLALLTMGLYPLEEETLFTQQYHQMTDRLCRTLARCLENGNAFLKEVVLHFCYLASNSPANLRLGNQRWNSIVGSDFDPTGWFYYSNGLGDCIISDWAFDEALGERNLIRVLRQRYREERQGREPVELPEWREDQWGFYLPSRADGIRINRLLDLGAPVNLQHHIVTDYGQDGRYYPVLHSSSNRFPCERQIRADIDMSPLEEPACLNVKQPMIPIPIYYRSAKEKDCWVKLVTKGS